MIQRSFSSIFFYTIFLLLLAGCNNLPGSILPATPTTIVLPTPMTLPTKTPTIAPEPTLTSPPQPTVTIEVQEEEPTIRDEIVVGSKEYTEQLILGQMLILMLEEAGYQVIDRTGLGGSTVVRNAIEQGQIDLYMELTGTALSVRHKLSASSLPQDSERSYMLAKDLDASAGLIWLDRGYFNKTYTLMVRQETIDAGITTIEELAAYMNENDSPWSICVETEFYGRQQDGLFGMLKRYGFEFKEEKIQVLELDQLYEQLRNENCDISEGFATDGRISAWGFHNLEDTLNFFPFYSPAPVIRQEKLEQYPELEELLGRIGAHLDDETMSQLNARVDIGADGELRSGDEESVEMVAHDFLSRSGLLSNRPQLVVGSQEDTQQLLLGQMLILMLQEEGYDVVDKTGLGEPTTLRTALERGEIDLYWEYTGTALSLFHEISNRSISHDKKRALTQARSLDERHYDMIWLDAAKFDYTFTLMMQEEALEDETKLETIGELAEYMNENEAPFAICVPSEFYGRETDGLFALEKNYDFSFKNENIVVTDLAQSYIGLRDGECDVAVGYNTDGRLDSWGFYNLVDDQYFFLPNVPAPITRKDVLNDHPTLKRLLSKASPYLDQAMMSKLNAQVALGPDGEFDSGDEESIKSVAQIFLCEQELLADCFNETVEVEESDAVAEEAVEAAAEAAAEAAEESDQLSTNANSPASNAQDAESSDDTEPQEQASEAAERTDESQTTGASCEQFVVNGDFEEDLGWAFSNTPLRGSYDDEQVHQGEQAMRLGLLEETEQESFSTISQWIVLPDDAVSATLTYWTYPISRDLVAGDIQGVALYDESFTNTIERLSWSISDEQAWVLHNHNISDLIGSGFYLYFVVINDGDEAPSAMYVDDVSLEVCYE